MFQNDQSLLIQENKDKIVEIKSFKSIEQKSFAMQREEILEFA